MPSPTSPAATGGAGSTFEARVGAGCLALLLTRGAPLFLGSGTLDAVHFQSGHFGFETDDLLLEATSVSGTTRKAVVQIKRSFVVRENSEECVQNLRRAFADFGNRELFDQHRDVIGLAVSTLSAKTVRGLHTLLTCARASTSFADMGERLRIPEFLGRPALDYHNTIVAILRGPTESRPTDDEIWRFLRLFNVVDLDLNVENGSMESMLRSLLAVTARDRSAASADATWNELNGARAKLILMMRAPASAVSMMASAKSWDTRWVRRCLVPPLQKK
jgi:hypothetical protein